MNHETNAILRLRSETMPAMAETQETTMRRWRIALAALLVCALAVAWPSHSSAQETITTEALPVQTIEELEELVGPIALYPDDLLAIVLPASTYPLQVVEAARLLEERENGAVVEPDEDWDESVIALLNYPDALRLLNDDLDWTWALGEAVLAQQEDVLEAVERFRDQAYLAGNLKTDDHQKVTRSEGVIEIEPLEQDVIYVPYYDPADVIVYQPRPVYYYYPTAYPVYYYPYRSIARFHGLGFYGVSSIFSISWHSRYLHLSFYDHYSHPYYGYYYAPDYFYRHYRVRDYSHFHGAQVRHDGRGRYRWHARQHRGARPLRRHYDRERFIASSVERSRAERRTGARDKRRITHSTDRASARDQRVRRADRTTDRPRDRSAADRQRQSAFAANSDRRTTAERANRRVTTDRASRAVTERPRRSDRLAVADARRQIDFARNRSATQRPDSANRRYTTRSTTRPDVDGRREQRRPVEAGRADRRRDVTPDSRPRAPAPARSQRAERPRQTEPARTTAPERQSRPRAAPERSRDSAPRPRSDNRGARSGRSAGTRSSGRRSGRDR
jgi:hypothetical protein